MIVTISDTRTSATDKSGDLISTLLKESGHHTLIREIVPDEETMIERTVKEGCENSDIDVILTSGGTGISHRDITIETIRNMFDKEIPGFGEIFRMLSYQEDIGSAAIMSRSIAGISKNTAVFSMPGSRGAVKLAMNRLILPELSHVVHEINKDPSGKK